MEKKLPTSESFKLKPSYYEILEKKGLMFENGRLYDVTVHRMLRGGQYSESKDVTLEVAKALKDVLEKL